MGTGVSSDSGLTSFHAARELRDLKDVDDEVQDVNFPWFHIVQWSCESLPANVIYKYNYDDIRRDVRGLTADPDTFLSLCPPAELEELSLLEEDQISAGSRPARPFSDFCLEWASALLGQIPTLGVARFRLVPARVKEDKFWRRYFCAVRKLVQQHVLHSSAHECEGEQDTRTSKPRDEHPPRPYRRGQ
eukprot:GHVT01016163.1.p1 GENE.GHVT01016163.1~~GHVT01016163.1.p1  ORF type:complete len:189 (+),score=11.59 GHVT01016163.1:1427-1993(+)